jgi:hypothetical protein
MYDFNFTGCETSEDFMQNGGQCQSGKMTTFFFHFLIFCTPIFCTPELMMLGDAFGSGNNTLGVSRYSQHQSGKIDAFFLLSALQS